MVAIVGPTASGKSEIAMRLAATRAELISIDSMQVYRGMDIGTAKPSVADRARVRHHMIDVVDPDDDYTVAQFQAESRRALDPLVAEASPVVVAGGSGLHMRALLDPLEFPASDPGVRAAIDQLDDDVARSRLEQADPEAGSVLDLANPRRVQRALEILEITGETPTRRRALPAAVAVRAYEARTPFVGVGIDPGDALDERVRRRLASMLEAGLLEEVRGLRGRLGRNAAQAVGYKELLPVVDGRCPIEEGVEAAARATVALAKRQRTFFRRDPRIVWVDWHEDPGVLLDRVRDAIGEGIEWIS